MYAAHSVATVPACPVQPAQRAWRQEVIAAKPELREGELAKLADYAAAVAAALRQRGASEPQAT